ncbi:hypothetical protein BX600DRAFT_491873 [Xylariales sp. PMI_506]|nr:hypothetical protein BX600DRAFT_491873 [Xylariales sp. PMI_506]
MAASWDMESVLSVDQRAQSIIDNKLVPVDQFDWLPLLTTLCEQDDDLGIATFYGDLQSDHEDFYGRKQAKDPENDKGEPFPPDTARKSRGSWNHVLYIPAWTDPRCSADRETKRDPRGVYPVKNPRRDALQTLRPALLPVDARFHPTEYAKRFGLHPDRNDGRSCLSPAASTTRDLLGYLQAQLDCLGNELKDGLVARTAARRINGELNWEGRGISAAVFEQWKSEEGIPTTEEVLIAAAEASEPFEWNDRFPPRIAELYQPLIQDVVDDQNWQRLFFRDLTTDELIKHNIHTMSNKQRISLQDQPLHELLTRDHWEDMNWRGNDQRWPRFAYRLEGEAQTYDAANNDNLWKSLQPSLQLATRILKSEPAPWAAARDLRTRQMINSQYDPRPENARDISHLTKMVPVENIDLGKCWPSIRTLAHAGFDSVSFIDKFLERHLVLRIQSGFHIAEDGVSRHFSYGSTRIRVRGHDSKIYVDIAAELIWPLLSDALSSSEKISTAWIITTTIIHELMHAVGFAVYLICGVDDRAPPLDLTADLTEMLKIAGKEMFDLKFCFGEHFWNKTSVCEMGFALEKDLFDHCVFCFSDCNTVQLPESIFTLPIIVAGEPFPMVGQPDALLRHVSVPVENYTRAVPIDWFQRFFQQEFWDDDFVKWGHKAFRVLPPDRAHLLLLNPKHHRAASMQEVFGERNWAFYVGVVNLLRNGGQRILAEYCRVSLFEIVGSRMLESRWLRELRTWRDDADDPISDTIATIQKEVADSERVKSIARDRAVLENAWRQRKSNLFRVDLPEWCTMFKDGWRQRWKQSGTIMKAALKLYGQWQKEIGLQQRMAFDLLMLQRSDRKNLFQSLGDKNPITVVYNDRMSLYSRIAESLAGAFQEASQSPQLGADATAWNVWYERFSRMHAMFEELKDIVARQGEIDEDDARRLRQSLATVPSSLWESRSSRLRKLAHREYNLLDPRVRAALNEFNDRLHKHTTEKIFFTETSPSDVVGQLNTLYSKNSSRRNYPGALVRRQQRNKRPTDGSRGVMRPVLDPVHRINNRTRTSKIVSRSSSSTPGHRRVPSRSRVFGPS